MDDQEAKFGLAYHGVEEVGDLGRRVYCFHWNSRKDNRLIHVLRRIPEFVHSQYALLWTKLDLEELLWSFDRNSCSSCKFRSIAR